MIIGQFLNPFSVYKNGYNFFFLFYFHLINYKIYVYREKIQFFLYAMYATRFVLTNSTIYYFVPFHPFFICFETLQTFTYREIGFFQTTAFVSTNSAIFSFVSSPSFFFFSFFFALEAYRIRNTCGKFISTGATMNFREFKV